MGVKTENRFFKYSVYVSLVAYGFMFYLRPESSPVVSTKSGNVQGIVSYSRDGRKFHEFRGIPFAEPPIGDLRFEPPQDVTPWSGTYDASKFGPSCLGFDFMFTGRHIGEESCLFLNVMTPQMETKPAKRKLLPVIVFIHGGAFQTGESKIHKGKFFMDEDVVLVVPNYRLGIFGFLTTNDDVVKGNMGLKDQVQALRWVQDNIEAFGGDPGQVTIMGESAGGGSVHMLMFTPMTHGLFHRGISMSCTAISDLWQLERSNLEHMELVAKEYGCPWENSRDFARCLKSMTAEKLAAFHVIPDYPEMYHDHHFFGPAIEHHNGSDYILNGHTAKLLKAGKVPNSVPWMVGVNENEGLVMLPRSNLLPGFDKFLQDDLVWHRYVNHVTLYNSSSRPEAAFAIRDHFFGNKTLKTTEDEAIRKMSSMITEKMFLRPLVESAKYHSRLSPTYVYMYTYKQLPSIFYLLSWSSPFQWVPELSVAFNAAAQVVKSLVFKVPFVSYGACHADELMMLFDLDVGLSYFISYFDGEMSRLFVKTIADFANASKPVTFNGIEWPQVNNTEPLPVMNIDVGQPKILIEPFENRLRFWNSLNIPWT